MTIPTSSLVAALLALDQDVMAALRRLRTTDRELAVWVAAVEHAARQRSHRFATGLGQPASGYGSETDGSATNFAGWTAMTTTEAGDALGITSRAVTAAINAGRLFAIRLGGRWAVPADAVIQYAAARAEGRPAT